jgi:hypothetical protein
MAIPFLNHLDLRSVSELQNAILHKTTSGSASDIEGKIIYDTGTDTIKYYSGSSGSGSWISLTGDTNTFRTVQVDGGAIGSSETLNLIGGTNITLDETDGAVTINGAAAMQFFLEDGDGTEVTINHNKEIKFVEGGGIDINWTDVSPGSDSDPYDLTFTNSDKGSSQNIFKTVATNPAHSGSLTYAQTRNLEADSNNDTLKLFDGTGIKIEGAAEDDIIRIKIADGGVNTTQLAADAVDGTKIADNALNSEHYTDGSVDNVHLANSSMTINGSARSLGDSFTTPNDDVSEANLKSRLAGFDSGDTVYIGDGDNDTVVVVRGTLTVEGTTTTVNSETLTVDDNKIVLNDNVTGTPTEDAGIIIERGNQTNVELRWDETDDDWEFTAFNHAGTPALTTYKIPTTYKTTIGDGSATAIAVSHMLGSRDVIVQLYDTSSYETVIADVVRTDTNRITITFGAAPASGDVTVLVSKVG